MEIPDKKIDSSRDQKRLGKSFNPKGTVFSNIDMGSGFVLNNRPGILGAILGVATGFVKVNSIFESFFKTKAKDSINAVIVGRQGNGESRFANSIELSANCNLDIENLALGYNNGIIKLRVTRDGVNPPVDHTGVTVADINSLFSDPDTEAVVNRIVGYGTNGGVTLAHVDDRADLPYTGGPRFVVNNSGTTVYGSFTNSSDERFKKDIENVKYGLKEIEKLRPVSFKYIRDKNEEAQYGFIAQEVKNILNDLVKEDKDGYLNLSYNGIIPILVKSIQELSERVKNLEQKSNE